MSPTASPISTAAAAPSESKRCLHSSKPAIWNPEESSTSPAAKPSASPSRAPSRADPASCSSMSPSPPSTAPPPTPCLPASSNGSRLTACRPLWPPTMLRMLSRSMPRSCCCGKADSPRKALPPTFSPRSANACSSAFSPENRAAPAPFPAQFQIEASTADRISSASASTSPAVAPPRLISASVCREETPARTPDQPLAKSSLLDQPRGGNLHLALTLVSPTRRKARRLLAARLRDSCRQLFAYHRILEEAPRAAAIGITRPPAACPCSA